MPCNCDHMEPSSIEIELSRVACLLDEFDGKPINKNFWDGMHPKVYNQTYDRYAGNFDASGMAQALVRRIKDSDVTKYSLEMQIWWRDYLAKQKEHEVKAIEASTKQFMEEKALAKLTEADKEILGL